MTSFFGDFSPRLDRRQMQYGRKIAELYSCMGEGPSTNDGRYEPQRASADAIPSSFLRALTLLVLFAVTCPCLSAFCNEPFGVTLRVNGTKLALSGVQIVEKKEFAARSLQFWIEDVMTCKKRNPSLEVIKLFVTTSPDSDLSPAHPDRLAVPSKAFDDGQSTWLAAYSASVPTPAAMVLMIGDRIIARRLTESGDVEDRSLGKGNAVLDVVLDEHLSDTFGPPEGELHFYVTTKSALIGPDPRRTADEAKIADEMAKIADEVTKGVTFPNKAVYIRNDQWFIEQLDFPVAYRFIVDKTAEGLLSYPVYQAKDQSNITFRCESDGNGYSCQPAGDSSGIDGGIGAIQIH